MTKKKLYRSWEHSKVDIKRTLTSGLYDAYDNELCISTGVQFRHAISHAPSPVYSVAYIEGAGPRCMEYYVMNFVSVDTGESIMIQWKYDPSDLTTKVVKKVQIRQSLKILLWIPLQHAFIGYCTDMTLRGYTANTFEEKSRYGVQQSILSMIYLEDFDELVAGGQGYVMSWNVRMIALGLLVDPKEPPLETDITNREWVHRLFYDKQTKTVMALTDQVVFIINIVTRRQVEVLYNTHEASLTYCAFYRPYFYFITAARDGTVHVYHTSVKALIHKFSAHRDGITGVVTLPDQPILISWSLSGCLRMWRLDTLELTNETTLADNIQFLQVPRSDRLLCLFESEVHIFDINILFHIFATLLSPAESIKLCNIRRSRTAIVNAAHQYMDHSIACSSDNSKFNTTENFQNQKSISTNLAEENSDAVATKHISFENIEQKNVKEEENLMKQENSKNLQNSEHNADPSTSSNNTRLPSKILVNENDGMSMFNPDLKCAGEDETVDACATSSLNSIPSDMMLSPSFESTFIDKRLVCVLDNHSIIGVSPVSGTVLNIVYPHPEMDAQCVAVDMEISGRSYYVVLSDGKLLEFDCSITPAELAATVQPQEGAPKVLSVIAMEVYVEEGIRIGQTRQGIFIGLENGYIKLHDGGGSRPPRTMARRGKRGNTRRRRSTVNEIGPVLTMHSFKAHYGEVTYLYVPGAESFTVTDANDCDAFVRNVLLSIGTDQRVIVWRVTTSPTNSPLRLEVLFTKLRFIRWDACPTCFALTSNVMLFGFENGNLEICTFSWKYLKSTQGAEIKVGGASVILHSITKASSFGRELLHRDKVTCVSESHVLKLFITTSKDKTMKIWDCDGQLIREILIGDVVQTVCFANGRDLLASFRNHIVKIEAHNYLPTEYLHKLLDMSNIVHFYDVFPEKPNIMEGVVGDLYISNIPDDSDEEDQAEDSKVSRIQQAQKKQSNRTKKGFRRSFFARIVHEAPSLEKDTYEVPEAISLQDATPPIRIQDRSELYVLSLNKYNMKKFPIAPDGYLPNSVIRERLNILFHPPTLELMKKNQFKMWLRTIKKNEEDETEAEFVGWTTDDDPVTRTTLTRFQSSLSEWLTDQDNSIKKQYKLRKVKKREKEVVNYPPPVSIKFIPKKQESIRPPQESYAASLEMDENQKRRIDRFVLLLEEVSRQRWCPCIITLKNFERSMASIAEVLRQAPPKVLVEICKCLCLLFDASYDPNDEVVYHNYFTANVQRVLGEVLSQLIYHTSPSVKKAALEVLCRFDDVVLKEIIMSSIMPKFLQRIPGTATKVYTVDETSIQIAVDLIKQLSIDVDINRLETISCLIGIETYRGKKLFEKETTAEISKTLVEAGIDRFEAAVWADFAIPLLTKKFEDSDSAPENKKKRMKKERKRHLSSGSDDDETTTETYSSYVPDTLRHIPKINEEPSGITTITEESTSDVEKKSLTTLGKTDSVLTTVLSESEEPQNVVEDDKDLHEDDQHHDDETSLMKLQLSTSGISVIALPPLPHIELPKPPSESHIPHSTTKKAYNVTRRKSFALGSSVNKTTKATTRAAATKRSDTAVIIPTEANSVDSLENASEKENKKRFSKRQSLSCPVSLSNVVRRRFARGVKSLGELNEPSMRFSPLTLRKEVLKILQAEQRSSDHIETSPKKKISRSKLRAIISASAPNLTGAKSTSDYFDLMPLHASDANLFKHLTHLFSNTASDEEQTFEDFKNLYDESKYYVESGLEAEKKDLALAGEQYASALQYLQQVVDFPVNKLPEKDLDTAQQMQSEMVPVLNEVHSKLCTLVDSFTSQEQTFEDFKHLYDESKYYVESGLEAEKKDLSLAGEQYASAMQYLQRVVDFPVNKLPEKDLDTAQQMQSEMVLVLNEVHSKLCILVDSHSSQEQTFEDFKHLYDESKYYVESGLEAEKKDLSLAGEQYASAMQYMQQVLDFPVNKLPEKDLDTAQQMQSEMFLLFNEVHSKLCLLKDKGYSESNRDSNDAQSEGSQEPEDLYMASIADEELSEESNQSIQDKEENEALFEKFKEEMSLLIDTKQCGMDRLALSSEEIERKLKDFYVKLTTNEDLPQFFDSEQYDMIKVTLSPTELRGKLKGFLDKLNSADKKHVRAVQKALEACRRHSESALLPFALFSPVGSILGASTSVVGRSSYSSSNMKKSEHSSLSASHSSASVTMRRRLKQKYDVVSVKSSHSQATFLPSVSTETLTDKKTTKYSHKDWRTILGNLKQRRKESNQEFIKQKMAEQRKKIPTDSLTQFEIKSTAIRPKLRFGGDASQQFGPTFSIPLKKSHKPIYFQQFKDHQKDVRKPEIRRIICVMHSKTHTNPYRDQRNHNILVRELPTIKSAQT